MARKTDRNGVSWEVGPDGQPVPGTGISQGSNVIAPNAMRVQQQERQYSRQDATDRRAENAATRADNNAAQSNAIAERNARLAQQKFEAELAKDGLMVGKDGAIVPSPSGPSKTAINDPQRMAQIQSLLEVIKRAREQSDDFLAVGEQGKNLREWPLVGGFLGQNRADVEGLVKSIDGDLIQQQIARLSQQNGGKGVASIANSETEAARMASAIANLSLDQSLPEFTGGLDRAEAYYNRQLEALSAQQGQASDNNYIPSASPPIGNGPSGRAPQGGNPSRTDKSSVFLGNGSPDGAAVIGTGDYATEADKAFQKKANALWNSGASAERVNQFIQDSGYGGQIKLIPANAQGATEYRDGTGRYEGTGRHNQAIVGLPTSGKRSDFQKAVNKALLTPEGTAAVSAVNAAGFGTLDRVSGGAVKQLEKENPKAAFAGDLGGSVLGAGLLAKGAAKVAGKYAPKLLGDVGRNAPKIFGGGDLANLGRALSTDVGYSGIRSTITDGDPISGIEQGLVGSLGGRALGNVAGKGVGALAHTNTATKASNAVRGMFGARQRPMFPQPSEASQMIANAAQGDGADIMAQLRQAKELGVPYSLADTHPGLRSLGSSSVQFSPNARGIAEKSFGQRSNDQYDRLLNADSGPLYDEAKAAPGAQSVNISGLTQTPMGQKAIQQAGSNVRNRLDEYGNPVDHNSIGFDYNSSGEAQMTKVPSFETLHELKQGLDDIIEGGYDPIARTYSSEARSATALKQHLVKEIDGINPAYAQARAAYAGPAEERAAFTKGAYDRPLSLDQSQYEMSKLTPVGQEQYKLGQRADMVNQAGRVRESGNPWNTVYGPTVAQQKIAANYPQGAGNFDKQYQFERTMADTNNKILGNSLSAERLAQAQAFGGVEDWAPSLAMDLATTGTPMVTGAKAVGKIAGGRLGIFGKKRKADALAPILFDTNAGTAAMNYDQLISQIKLAARAKRRWGNTDFSQNVGSQSVATSQRQGQGF
jgi:hypothetical protein